MVNVFFRSTLRDIKNSFGRWIAILLIIALGVGFFVGLRITQPSMIATGDKYINDYNLYDFRLLSTLGFTEEDVEQFRILDGVQADGAYTVDIIAQVQDESEVVLKLHSITEHINKLNIKEGRMPEADNECVVDSRYFGSNAIGQELIISASNEEESANLLKYERYTIVGLADSVIYMNFERGTTSVGTGNLSGFAYLPEAGFESEYYHEIYVDVPTTGTIYSDEYEESADAAQQAVEDLLNERGDIRYQSIVDEAENELNDAQEELDANLAEYESSYQQAIEQFEQTRQELDAAAEQIRQGEAQLETLRQSLSYAQSMGDAQQAAQLQYAVTQAEQQLSQARETYTAGEAEYQAAYDEAMNTFAESKAALDEAQASIDEGRQEIASIARPTLYILGRDTNVGYVCFENDSAIVAAVSYVFPVFFFLVAALVCMTTMTRMIDESRGQIGILKALGYSNGRIYSKFMFYSGSAAVLGWLIGYFAGSYFIPILLWQIYNIMYGFAPLEYVFSVPLFVICLAVALICSCGTAYISCRNELKPMPAELIRGKTPKAGKKVFLERITFLWKRLSFLHKVSARNIFRFKNRLVMMLIGIGGCTALLVTGFGVRDSIQDVVQFQFDEITIYDYAVSIDSKNAEDTVSALEACEGVTDSLLVMQSSVDLVNPDDQQFKSVTLLVSSSDTFDGFVDFHDDEDKVNLPDRGQVLLNKSVADNLDLKIGDTVQLRNSDMQTAEYTISGLFDNYLYNYAIVSSAGYADGFGVDPEYNEVYLLGDEQSDRHEVGARLASIENVGSVTVNEDVVTRMDNTMASLNYIVLLVLVCAAALAFIVLYNLTNININERVKEIATIKVLGFYKNEVSAYVFREIIVLTLFGAVIGLPLGKLLHSFVMAQIRIDMVSFQSLITPLSYVISVALTLVFAAIINIVMARKLDKIDMAQSLKSVE